MKQGAKTVVEDWNRGKLKYFTFPPQNVHMVDEMVGEH
jgi:ribosome biogenesis GTPase A